MCLYVFFKKWQLDGTVGHEKVNITRHGAQTRHDVTVFQAGGDFTCGRMMHRGRGVELSKTISELGQSH